MKSGIWRSLASAWTCTNSPAGGTLTKIHVRVIGALDGRSYCGQPANNLPFEEIAMRFAFAAIALCSSLAALAATPPAPQTPPAAPAAPSATQAGNDAAAKHARRTACLKEAKARKLISAEKTAFIKHCTDAPREDISASHVAADRP
jgi:hypothetical protein